MQKKHYNELRFKNLRLHIKTVFKYRILYIFKSLFI